MVALCAARSSSAAGGLPARLSDEEFWRLTVELSEPPGTFLFENYVSNEITYQRVIPELTQTVTPGKAYLGVGPEQNFTYIAAVRPAIAFIVDIRRQNLLEHLLYKAIFEIASDRADFVSRLFSRRRPWRLKGDAPVEELMGRFDKGSFPSLHMYRQTLREVKTRLVGVHRFPLTGEDERGLATVLKAFKDGGPAINYSFDSRAPRPNANHTYVALMTASDGAGRQWSYLASEENFRRVQDLQRRNLVVPVVGNFAGAKAIQAVGAYLKAHGVTVGAFYASNVEEYIRKPLGNYSRFCSSVASLPIEWSSTFIRWTSGTAPRSFLNSIAEFTEAFTEGRVLPFEIRAANRRVLARISCNETQ